VSVRGRPQLVEESREPTEVEVDAAVRAVGSLVASREDQAVEYPSPWDHRRLPLDLFGLDERKREVLREWDRHRDEFKALGARIEDGRAKIAAAQEAGKPAEKVIAAEARLAQLENQLRSQRWRYDLPCDALAQLFEVARSLTKGGAPRARS
jgi:hypothetical protein